jgi:hypothetical protein
MVMKQRKVESITRKNNHDPSNMNRSLFVEDKKEYPFLRLIPVELC